MATINLAPGTQYIVAIRKRRRRLFAASAIVVILAAVAWGALGLISAQTIKAKEIVDNQARNLNVTIAQAQSDAGRVVSFEKRLVTLNTLLDRHIVWNPIFTELERLLPAPTVLTSAIFDAESGTIELKGTTTDIDQVAQTMASLRTGPAHQTLFTDGTIQTVARTEVEPGPDNPAGLVYYAFTAHVTFNAAALRPGK